MSESAKAVLLDVNDRQFEVEAVLLDVDGVILDSDAPDHWSIVADIAGASVEEVHAVVSGMRTRDAILRCAEIWSFGDPLDVYDQFEIAAVDDWRYARLFAGARELIEGLNFEAPRWGVVTSNAYARKSFELLGLSIGGVPTMTVHVGPEDVMMGKPAPDCYTLASERLEIKPSASLVIEDSPHGVTAARRAGIGCIVGVLTTSTENELMAAGATAIVRDLTCVRVIEPSHSAQQLRPREIGSHSGVFWQGQAVRLTL